LGIQELPDDRKTSERLGLTLLSFEKLADPVEASLPRVEGARPDDLVGRVLSAIKGKISEGEPPTIGRNRLVGHVDGTNGNVIVKDANDPQPVNPNEFAPLAESEQLGSRPTARPGIKVAIIDTTLRPHPFLAKKDVTPPPERFEVGVKYPFRAGHGTFVTGLIVGEAPFAAVTVEGTLDKDGRASSWDVAEAILKCADEGAQIINLSLACYTFDGVAPLVFAQAISRLPADTLVIAAAGNMANQHPPAKYRYLVPDLSQAPAWPAALPTVVAVGAAMGPNYRRRAPFSPNAPWVNVLAPGVDVVSILPEGVGEPLIPATGYAQWSGTSFSAAEITGAVAERAATQSLSPETAYIALRDEGANSFIFLNDEF
jgi:subtilisin family serine protease